LIVAIISALNKVHRIAPLLLIWLSELGAAGILYRIATNARARCENMSNNTDKSSHSDSIDMGVACMGLYLFHPFNLLASAGQSTASLMHCLLLGTLYLCQIGNPQWASILLAIATCISPFAICMLAVLVGVHAKGSSVGGLKSSFLLFTLTLLVVSFANFQIAGTWKYLWSSYFSLYVHTCKQLATTPPFFLICQCLDLLLRA
jgi:hypothetical protein